MADKLHHANTPFRASERRRRLPAWVLARVTGPGALYNLGNLIALTTGAGLAVWQLRGQMDAMSGLQEHLMGSAPAAWLTASILVFIISGEVYHAAHHGAAARQTRLLQWADFISGLAAIGLTIALIGFGDTAMAILAGVMLAGGKLGSAVLPVIGGARLEPILRLAVLGSRAPSIAALVLSLHAKSNLIAAPALAELLMPMVMIGCFLLWAWADLILLRPSWGKIAKVVTG